MRLFTTIFLTFLGIFALSAQENCPSFKIKRNKGVRFNSFTTALKFQLDGVLQRNRLTENDAYDFIKTPMLSVGIEQSVTPHFSFSLMTGYAANPANVGSRIALGDIRYYFSETYTDKWLAFRMVYVAEKFEEGNQFVNFYSVHYGVTRTLKRIFSHYDIGVGYNGSGVWAISLCVSTGLKL